MKKEVKIILVSCLFVIVNFSIRSGTTIHGESFIGQTFKAGSFSYEVISKNEVLVYKYDHQEPDTMEVVSSVEYQGKKYNVTKFHYDHSDAITKKIIIPSGVKEVIINPDGVPGYKYPNLEELIFPDTLEYINPGFSFTMTNLNSIQLSDKNKYYKVEDNVLFSKNGTDLIAFPSGDDRISYRIPNGVRTIKKEAFASNQNLQDVLIPVSLTELEPWTFAGSHIQRLDLSHVKKAGRGTFEFCHNLKEIKLGRETVLNGGQFYENRSLKDISVEEGNPKLWSEDGVLYGRSGDDKTLVCYPSAKEELSYAVSPATNCIEDSAFYMCRLDQVFLPPSVQKISSSAFNYGNDGKAEKPIQIYLCGDRLPEIEKAAFTDLASGSVIYLKNQELKNQFDLGNQKNLYIDQQDKESVIQVSGMEQQPAEDIILDSESVSLDMGKDGRQVSRLLEISLFPLSSTDKIIVSGSDHRILTVSDLGRITAVSPGTAFVTVKAGNVRKECRVTVYGPLGNSDDIPIQFYTGAEIRPEPVVRNHNGQVLKRGNDYTVEYKNNKNPGRAEVLIEGIGCFQGSIKTSFDIRIKGNDVSGAKVVYPQRYYYYEGKPVTPKPAVSLNGRHLEEGRDYCIEYMGNNGIGFGCVCLTGINDYYGQNFSYYQIIRRKDNKKNYEKISFVSQPKNSVYTGKSIFRTVRVKSGNRVLKLNKDYTVKYTANKNCGKARMEVIGKGGYTGKIKRYFVIVPKKARIRKIKAGKKKAKVYIRKSPGKPSGYQICWSAGKKFSKSKSVSTAGTARWMRRLKRKKYYYIKVRAYKTINGKKYFGSYSGIKRVKIK